MNKLLRFFFLFLVALLIINQTLFARTFLIKVDSANTMSFSPNALSVGAGDTIMWIWAAGVHTITSDSIPAGAKVFNDTVSSVKQTFTYMPTKQGTYTYYCAFHRTMGMTGYFVVGPGTNVPLIAGENFTVSPNPARDEVIVHSQLSNMHISLYDIIGKQVGKWTQTGKETSLDVSNIPSGVYMLRLISGSNAATIKLTIAR